MVLLHVQGAAHSLHAQHSSHSWVHRHQDRFSTAGCAMCLPPQPYDHHRHATVKWVQERRWPRLMESYQPAIASMTSAAACPACWHSWSRRSRKTRTAATACMASSNPIEGHANPVANSRTNNSQDTNTNPASSSSSSNSNSSSNDIENIQAGLDSGGTTGAGGAGVSGGHSANTSDGSDPPWRRYPPWLKHWLWACVLLYLVARTKWRLERGAKEQELKQEQAQEEAQQEEWSRFVKAHASKRRRGGNQEDEGQ